jgi:hypothetical protein
MLSASLPCEIIRMLRVCKHYGADAARSTARNGGVCKEG